MINISVIYLDYIFIFVKVFFFIFLSPKYTFFPLILILDEKKSKEFFYNNLGVQGVITYFAVGLNESYFNIMASSCSEMHFLRKKFVNKWIKHETHLIDKKSSNHARNSSYKNFVPMIPFKFFFFWLKKGITRMSVQIWLGIN